MSNATTYLERKFKHFKQNRPCTQVASRMSSPRRRGPGITTGAQSLVGSARRNPHRGRCDRVILGQGAQRLHFGWSPQGQFVLTGRERRGIGARRAVRGGVAVGPCCSCGSRGHQARGLVRQAALHHFRNVKQMKVTLRLGLFIGLTVLCRSFIMLETTKERTTKGVDHEPGSRTDLQPPTLAGAPVLRTRTRRRRRTRKRK